ncbi:MAG: carbon-nitrogen hydrolase family protein [Bradyrhizobiaceae bacterium]|nr:MAG: carbon-nitrogen hydrolase family protein [Bradyrhizobiaceae bacterium]
MQKYPKFKAAVMHVAPVFLDTARTVDKVCALIEEAAGNGAELMVFSETFISAFPIWSALNAPIHNHGWFRKLAASAIMVPGPEIDKIAATARKVGAIVSIGINEGSQASVGCIWNSNILIGSDGTILNHHRKLVPTFWEKMAWANGDGAGLKVVETDIGKIGMLICGENFNPLARFAMIAQGEQIHLSSYPPVWPAHDPKESSYSVAEGIRIRANAHALEAKVFNLVAASFMDGPMLEQLSAGNAESRRILEDSPRGISMIVSPTGAVIAGPAQNEEAIVYGDIDTAECVEPKQLHDLSGYYNRFDVFKLTIDRSANQPAIFEGDENTRDAAASLAAREDSQESGRIYSLRKS